MNPQIEVGALVKMRLGYSEPGLLLELIYRDITWGPKDDAAPPAWARVLWPDEGLGIEKVRDLEVVA